MNTAPALRDRAGFYATISPETVAEGRAARAVVASARDREYRIRTRGACLLCRDDEPSASYVGRFWCRACGRLW